MSVSIAIMQYYYTWHDGFEHNFRCYTAICNSNTYMDVDTGVLCTQAYTDSSRGKFHCGIPLHLDKDGSHMVSSLKIQMELEAVLIDDAHPPPQRVYHLF